MKPKTGILVAFGELFLKSEKVRKIFQRKLENNIALFLKRENLPFSLFSFHERIFVETPKIKR